MDESQQSSGVRGVAAEVQKILTPNESLLYVAVQNIAAMTLTPDAAVATSNRLILFRPALLGRVTFEDVPWQDVRNARIAQGVLSTDLTVETVDGRTLQMKELDKEQAKRLYAVAQQMEQEWREKRRVREMEEARARAGGIVMGAPAGGATPEDPVARLAKAKQMLDQGLISETEYDALKARILSGI
jgi:hypothetical protein